MEGVPSGGERREHNEKKPPEWAAFFKRGCPLRGQRHSAFASELGDCGDLSGHHGEFTLGAREVDV